ncbi:MAG: pre-16S rRNA-processing nuclease YqgF [Candidatus Pacebacteria bacterium]|nr:pre-16S rRNA-processing nuclease YqgF [Candidatus Paceibacterota bacterium]
MKYLGIDYGTKRVGIAVSDDSGSIAFPREILVNDKDLIGNLLSLVTKDSVETVVIGYSTKQDGSPNPIMDDLEGVTWALEDAGVQIVFEKEWFSSHEAALQNFNQKSALTTRPDRASDKALDSQAAAIILQRYLDKQKASS